MIERMEKKLESQKMQPIPGTSSIEYDHESQSDILRKDIDNMITSSAEIPDIALTKPGSENDETVRQIFADALRSKNRNSEPGLGTNRTAPLEPASEIATFQARETEDLKKLSNAERKAQFRATVNRPSSSSLRRYGHSSSFGNSGKQQRRRARLRLRDRAPGPSAGLALGAPQSESLASVATYGA